MPEENLNRDAPGIPPPSPPASQPYGSGPSEHPRPPRKRRQWIAWIVVLLLFGLAFYLVLHHKETAAAAPAGHRGFGTVTVTTGTASNGSIGVYLDSIGTVTPVYTAQVTAQAGGVITEVHYREGQYVRKGDPLIDLDPRPYRAQVLQAEGALERDQNLLAEAQMDLQRYRDAWARNAIPKQTLDDQEKLVLQYQGTVKNDQGTLQYDQVQLSYCHIVSPISGRVGLRLVDPGNLVVANATTALVVVTQIQPITVIFTIPEDNIGEVQARMRTQKTLPVEALDRSQTVNLASGKLFTLDNQINTTTGTVQLRALFANKNGALFPNQFVNTKLLVDTQRNVILVPSNAIQHNGEVAFVYALENNVAKVHNVTPGVTDNNMTAVRGLDAGTVVATSSFEKLLDGAKVSISQKPIPANTTESNTP
jgi:multidrug efflux system membrane fusion protein